MNYYARTDFRAAPLVLRSSKRRDYFPHYTILLGLMLAVFGLIYGAPIPPATEAGVIALYGP